MTNGSQAPACPRCGHPDEPGRWCNWCGAWLGPPLEDSDRLSASADTTRPLAVRRAEATAPGRPTGAGAEAGAGAPTTTDRTTAGGATLATATTARAEHATDVTTTPSQPSPAPTARLPDRGTLLAIVGLVVLALWAVPRLLPDPPRAEGPRVQASGTVDVTAAAWITDDFTFRPSRYTPPPGPFEVDLTGSTAVIHVDDQVIEVDRSTGEVVDRAPAPTDSSTQPQVVVSDSVRIVDPVGGDILRVIELPQDWYVLDGRDRGGRILLARTDPSGLSPFDSLAALDLTSGRLMVFEAEAPQSLVGGVLSPDGTRFAIVREFDRNGLYLDVEREALSIGQIRLPTPESVVNADSLWLDAVGTTVVVAYERSFPNRPVATSLHLRAANGTTWDAEVPGGTPVAGVALELDAGRATVFVRRADNQVSAWVDGERAWTVDGPPRLVAVDDVAVGPRDGVVLARTTDVTPWRLVTTAGRTTSTPVQGTDLPVAIDGGFVFSRAGELRAIDGRSDDLLDREAPVRGIPSAGHGTTVAGAFTVGCDGVCVVDLANRELLLQRTDLAGSGRWYLGPEHVAAGDGQGQGGVTVVRISDGEVVAQLLSARLAGPADDGHLVVEVPVDDQVRLAWLPLDGGEASQVTAPHGTRAAHGAFSGNVAVVPTSSGLARVDRGGVRWTVDLPGITTAPVIVGDQVVVGRAGQLIVLSLGDGEVVARSEEDLLPGVVWWLVPGGDVLFAGGDGYVAGLPIARPGG